MPKLYPPADPKPCHHPQARHQHGTEQCYISDRCHCPACRSAHARAAAARRRKIAYGRWQPATVSNIGSRRRIEALACLGWSMSNISDRIGCTNRALQRLFEDGVLATSRAKADAITAVYDELWNTRAPQTTRGERIGARRVLAIARERNYAPPLAWDDETIDDPAAQPAVTADPVDELDEVAVLRLAAGTLRTEPGNGRPTPPEVVEAIRRLAALRYNDTEIGQRIGKSPDAIGQIRRRYDIAAGQQIEEVAA